MHARRPVALLTLVLLGAGGCGAETADRTPATSFPADATRVWESYDQSGGAVAEVPVEEDASRAVIRIDCVGAEAEIVVRLGGPDGWGGGVPTCPDGDEQPAVVVLESEEDPWLEAGSTVSIEVLPGGGDDVRWSVAVDLEP